MSPALPVLGACGRFRDENEGAILIAATNRSDVTQRVLEDLGVPDPERPAPPRDPATRPDLGPFELKGVSAPVRVYELEGVGALHTPLEVSRSRGFSRFVGRVNETATLEAALARALGGEAQVVGVVGERPASLTHLNRNHLPERPTFDPETTEYERDEAFVQAFEHVASAIEQLKTQPNTEDLQEILGAVAERINDRRIVALDHADA